ncbi:hypothetical protein V500_07827 [Pseudogymnoascus sp. VKM F-4518 (FW-2643)]|nr:hypothetical protein V500_07827 [Pseudogymnoascus sp. VKM F-4518 (FW-2643)]
MPRITRSSQADRVRALVAPIASFYATLSTFPYLPASDILTPPASGWPDADFRKLGKTDLVVDVLRHLPYVRVDAGREWRLGYDDTKPLTYVRAPGAEGEVYMAACKLEGLGEGAAHEALWEGRLEPHGQKLDAHVVALTDGWMYGAWLLLDTEAGTIRDFSLLGGRSSAVKCPQEDRDAGLVWKHFPATPVKEFFTDWEGKYKSFEWMPVQDKGGGQSGEIFSQAKLGVASKEPAELRKIFKDHGWGSANFQKEECRKALREWSVVHGKRILEEYDNRPKRPYHGPVVPNPLDDISD